MGWVGFALRFGPLIPKIPVIPIAGWLDSFQMGSPPCLCSVGRFMPSITSLAGRTQGPACSRITQICLFLQALNEEIVNRKKNVDQAIRNGQALLKQTTGNTEEILACSGKCGGSGNPSSTCFSLGSPCSVGRRLFSLRSSFPFGNSQSSWFASSLASTNTPT